MGKEEVMLRQKKSEKQRPAGRKLHQGKKKTSLSSGSFLRLVWLPKTDSGLGKNTPQTGRVATERFGWRLLRAAVPALPLLLFLLQPTERGQVQQAPIAGALYI